jgi:IS5 family transposase
LALEEELKDRLSFRNFVGLDSAKDSPDETTFVRFRQKLQEHNLEETAFNLIRDDLRKDNLEIKRERKRVRSDTFSPSILSYCMMKYLDLEKSCLTVLNLPKVMYIRDTDLGNI